MREQTSLWLYKRSNRNGNLSKPSLIKNQSLNIDSRLFITQSGNETHRNRSKAHRKTRYQNRQTLWATLACNNQSAVILLAKSTTTLTTRASRRWLRLRMSLKALSVRCRRPARQRTKCRLVISRRSTRSINVEWMTWRTTKGFVNWGRNWCTRAKSSTQSRNKLVLTKLNCEGCKNRSRSRISNWMKSATSIMSLLEKIKTCYNKSLS